jgi:hypothetical protein
MPASAFRHIKELYLVFWRRDREKACILIAQRIEAEESLPPRILRMAASTRADSIAAPAVGGQASRMILDVVGVAWLRKRLRYHQGPQH